MNAEELPLAPLLAGTLAALYFGYEIDRRRHRMRSIFCTFDKRESVIASALEQLVESGSLAPYRPAPGA